MLKPYVCVKQHDITDCGAACLATVARVHGLKIPIATIRQYAGTDRSGTNVLGMVEAAQQLGFEAKGVRGNKDALAQIPLPCIAHVVAGDTLHYVVIHKVTARHVTVADPARGIIRHTRAGFAAMWSGILVLLIPSATFRAGERSTTVWRRFARLLAPHDFLLVETFLATLFLMLLGLGSSIYIQLLVDKVLADKNWTMLRSLSLGLMALIVCRALFGAIRGALLACIGQKVDLSLMIEYYRYVVRLPMRFFETRQTGEIISRLNDVIKIREVISGSTLTLLVDTSTMVAGFIILSLYGWKLALLSLALLPLIALIIHIVNRPLKHSQRSTMEEAAGLQSHLVESLTGVATLKAFGAEEAAACKTEARIVRLLRHLFRTSGWGVCSNTAGEMVTSLGAVGILWTAGGMVIRGHLTVGQMVAFNSILLYLLQPMLRLVGVNQTVQDAVVAAERLGEILDLEPEFREESKKITLPADAAGRIDFRNVSFRYGKRAPVLHEITLCLPPRSLIALVGESGSGKTTLAKLLLRYYDPAAGQIEIDGYDLRDLRLGSLRARIGYVDQDVFLFSGTIEENLALGLPRVTLDVIADAIRAVELDPFIASLPHRYQTHIGERGWTLSGGQRQRLAIARALVRDPQILIFDEATGNLDAKAEQAILNTIGSLKQRKTIILITHRLSVAVNADWIVVLDKGRILEQGTHRQLIQAQGFYHSLWCAQYSSANLDAAALEPPVPQVVA